MRIEIYQPSLKNQWDDFVCGSKNGTFLFLRDYMDYHCDRFTDNSLLFFNDKEQLVALLPANKKDNELISHGGLTYGGFITNKQMKTDVMLMIFEQASAYLRKNNFSKLIYKPVPHIYHRFPAEEDLYALFRFNAILYRRDVSSTISLSNKVHYQERRIRAIKKAVAQNVTCKLSDDLASYWKILEENLATVYDVKPVHSLAEIEVLRRSFPENIKLFSSFFNGKMVAGVLIYETEHVSHAQYIASSSVGRSVGALDLLFHFLLSEIYVNKPFFDFGIATEKRGMVLNSGLIDFKEGLGGRAIAYDFYEMRIEL